jgi:hypothetical protein
MKRILLITMIITLLILPACANNSENNAANTGSGDNHEEGNTENNENNINQLAFGVFLLEESDFAVTPEQAEEILFLWKVAKSLVESSTAAEAELTAISNQISDLLSDEQSAYLLTTDIINQKEIGTLLAEYGFEVSKRPYGEGSDEATGKPGNDLGAVGGSPGKGNGQGAGSKEISPEMLATKEAMRTEFGGAGFGMNTMIFDAVIEFLESKIQ